MSLDCYVEELRLPFVLYGDSSLSLDASDTSLSLDAIGVAGKKISSNIIKQHNHEHMYMSEHYVNGIYTYKIYMHFAAAYFWFDNMEDEHRRRQRCESGPLSDHLYRAAGGTCRESSVTEELPVGTVAGYNTVETISLWCLCTASCFTLPCTAVRSEVVTCDSITTGYLGYLGFYAVSHMQLAASALQLEFCIALPLQLAHRLPYTGLCVTQITQDEPDLRVDSPQGCCQFNRAVRPSPDVV